MCNGSISCTYCDYEGNPPSLEDETARCAKTTTIYNSKCIAKIKQKIICYTATCVCNSLIGQVGQIGLVGQVGQDMSGLLYKGEGNVTGFDRVDSCASPRASKAAVAQVGAHFAIGKSVVCHQPNPR